MGFGREFKSSGGNIVFNALIVKIVDCNIGIQVYNAELDWKVIPPSTFWFTIVFRCVEKVL
jgi:hypothetical protein